MTFHSTSNPLLLLILRSYRNPARCNDNSKTKRGGGRSKRHVIDKRKLQLYASGNDPTAR